MHRAEDSLATSVRPEPSRPASPTTSPSRTARSNGCHQRRRPRPSAGENGAPAAAARSPAGALLGGSSSRPSISEISFSGGSSAVGAGADQAAVAQHRDAVGDLVDLVDEVGDEDDRDAAPLKSRTMRNSSAVSLRVEAGGRLVEHQHARVVFERARDRDELLDGDRIGAERPLDVDVDIEPLQRSRAPLARLAPGISPNRRGWRPSVRFLVTDMVGTRLTS